MHAPRSKALGRQTSALAAAACLALAACTPSGFDGDELVIPTPEFVFPRPITPLPTGLSLDVGRVQLGRLLFHDPRLSGDGTISCASCHDVRRGGADYGRRFSTGVAGRKGRVNTPTVFNSALNFAQFWDGRAGTLEEQILETLQAPSEMAADLAAVRRTLAGDARLAARFARAYEDGLTERNVVDAIATYVRALITPNSPFDRYLAGERDVLGGEALAGFELFERFGCLSCHQGRNVGGNLFQRFGVMGDYFADRGELTEADYGRYNVTGRERDRFVFKVPSLRNVADRPPYFHDGSAQTLEEAVRIMVRYQLGRPAEADEVVKLIAFLEALTGELDESLL